MTLRESLIERIAARVDMHFSSGTFACDSCGEKTASTPVKSSMLPCSQFCDESCRDAAELARMEADGM
jgi:hypothetical protein